MVSRTQVSRREVMETSSMRGGFIPTPACGSERTLFVGAPITLLGGTSSWITPVCVRLCVVSPRIFSGVYTMGCPASWRRLAHLPACLHGGRRAVSLKRAQER